MQIFAQTGRFHFQRRSDSGQLAVSGGNRSDYGEITSDLRYLLLEQEIGFVIKVPGAIQHIAANSCVNVLAFRKQLNVFGNAAGDGVHLNTFTAAFMGKEFRIIPERNLREPDLRCAPPVQRAAVCQSLGLHHRDQRAAQNDHDLTILQNLLPYPLKDGRKGRIRFADILKFVDNDHRFFIKGCIHDGLEDHIPIFHFGCTQEVAVDKLCRLILERQLVLRLGFLTGKEKQSVFIFDKLGNQRGFSHSAPPI